MEDEELAGMNMDIGESMFDTFGQPPPGALGPDPNEMAEQMKRAQVERKVEMKELCVRTYDLGDPNDVEQYRLDMEHIIIGVNLKTHSLMGRDKQFVETPKPRWIAHLEWIEFTLHETPVAPVGYKGKSDAGENSQDKG